MSNDYGEQAYWDQRYSEDNELFDWYQRYDTLQPVIHSVIKGRGKVDRVLHVGCGNSELGEVSVFVNIGFC
jgi:hypothetical protein